jgi:hypothetical protein
MDHVQKNRMRMHPLLALAFAGAAVVACDSATGPHVVGVRTGGVVGGVGGFSPFSPFNPFNMILSPNHVILNIGQSVQILVNVPDTLRGQLLWRSTRMAS